MNILMELVENLLLNIRECSSIPSVGEMSGVELAAARLANELNRPDLDPDYDPEWNGYYEN